MNLDDWQKDVHVFDRDATNWPFGAPRTPAKWFAQEPDGTLHSFMTEDAACEFQRFWRKEHGLDPMTGEIDALCERLNK